MRDILEVLRYFYKMALFSIADNLQYPNPPPMLYFKPSNLSPTLDNSTYTHTFIHDTSHLGLFSDQIGLQTYKFTGLLINRATIYIYKMNE